MYDIRIRSMMHYKIFIHCDDDIRLCRRLVRDINERGREADGVLLQYNKFVKRSFDDFIKPTMNFADIIVPGSRYNQVAITFIVHHLKNLTKQMGQLKQKMNTLFYFGDILYHLDNLLQPQSEAVGALTKELKTVRRFIFPQDEIVKSDLHSLLSFLNKNYSSRQLYKSIKGVQKQALYLLQKTMQFENIPMTQVIGMRLGELLS